MVSAYHYSVMEDIETSINLTMLVIRIVVTFIHTLVV